MPVLERRCQLPVPQLRELDAATEQLELKLRSTIETTMAGDASRVPSHVLQKVDERIARAVKKNAAFDADRYKTLAGKLEYFDLRELQDTITGKEPWAQFEPLFGTKETLKPVSFPHCPPDISS
jgi:hypothetical protein